MHLKFSNVAIEIYSQNQNNIRKPCLTGPQMKLMKGKNEDKKSRDALPLRLVIRCMSTWIQTRAYVLSLLKLEVLETCKPASSEWK